MADIKQHAGRLSANSYSTMPGEAARAKNLITQLTSEERKYLLNIMSNTSTEPNE